MAPSQHQKLLEYDVLDGFEALDDEKLGLLSMGSFYTLFLGLGYPRLTIEQLAQRVERVLDQPGAWNGNGSVHSRSENGITVQVAIEVCKQFWGQMDHNNEFSKSFALVDSDGKGYLTASDLQALSDSLEGTDSGNVNGKSESNSLSWSQATAIIHATTGSSTTSRITLPQLKHVLSPP